MLVLIAGEKLKPFYFAAIKTWSAKFGMVFATDQRPQKKNLALMRPISISQLDDMVPKLMGNQAKLFYSLGADSDWDAHVTGWLNKVREQARTGVSAPESIARCASID